MTLSLAGFDYFFHAQETTGGLVRTEWSIAPSGEMDEDQAKQEMWALAHAHADLLDRTFQGLVEGHRSPTLAAAPQSTMFTWTIRYTLTEIGRRQIRSRLADMFGLDRIDGRGEFERAQTFEAGIILHVMRAIVAGHRDDAKLSLKVEHKLGHAVNVCLLRHLRETGGLEIDAATAAQMDRLETLLAVVDDRWTPEFPVPFANPDAPAAPES